jgi:hypothetical protein
LFGAALAPVFGLATHLVFPDLRTITSHERWTVAGLSSWGRATNQVAAAASPIEEHEREHGAALFRRRGDSAGSAGALVGDDDVGSDVHLSGRGHV